jgi:hypothetical protein
MPLAVLEVLMRIDPLGDLSFDRLRQQALSAVSKNAGQHVLAGGRWQRNDLAGTLSHGGVLLGNVVLKQPNSNPSTPPSSTLLIHNFRV